MVMALPEIRLLQAAIALAEDLNFSRAAERLHLTQPALSKQIFELEAQLGFQLFERNHQIVDLTAAGRAFVEEAREAVLRIESGDSCESRLQWS
jgi:DNA-binding transcriptional LysR family regulator